MEHNYSIKQVEILSGIKSHTLRIWEKRYGIIEPKRTEANIRYFTEQDLKKILNISFLNKIGIKVSKIAELSEDEINIEVFSKYEKSKNTKDVVELLSIDIFNYDLYSFKEKVNDYLKVNSFDLLIKEIIYPLFNRIGIMWQTNLIVPAQEHLFSHYIRQMICSEINNIKRKPSRESILLYLRESEYHELGLLLYHYVLAKKGYHVFYFGQSVPFEDIEHAIYNIKPKIIMTNFLAYLDADDFNLYINKLEVVTKDIKIYLSGNVTFLNEHKKNHKYTVIEGLDELDQIFNYEV
jgi:DNA-binding transcriptional MerR regulator